MADDTQDINAFVERLVEEKGIRNVDPEVREQIKKDLTDRVEDRVNAVILEKMPPAKLEEFSTIVDRGSEADAESFCAANIPNLDQHIAVALLQFRDSYLNA